MGIGLIRLDLNQRRLSKSWSKKQWRSVKRFLSTQINNLFSLEDVFLLGWLLHMQHCV